VVKRGEVIRMRNEGERGEVRAMFLNLRGSTAGVIRLLGPFREPRGVPLDAILPGLLDDASVALDRARLVEESERASVLARSEEMKSVLLSGVSHDLRSPLTAIKAAVSNLRDPAIEWQEADRDAFLETIDSQTDRLTRTVANLLELSRLEAGVTARLEPIELGPLAAELALSGPVEQSDRLRLSIPDETWVRADYGLLYQALANLLQNASKYSTPGTAIELSAAFKPGRVFIRVADNGPGIPQEDLPHIFEKFYRGSRTGAAKGSGLGLALAKAMVEACRGTIRVESSPAGTVFEVSLPAAAEPSR
ncbi:MAG TPA: ATP-binding protein, partial [Tepidiformaceae bacterium]|nr:ATP-binding protein [Tepidiformaceae bacterium]